MLSDPASKQDDKLGVSVAISADTIVAGAMRDTLSAGPGAAYVFKRTGSTWAQEALLTASNGEVGDRFGVAVGPSSDTIVVGARSESSAATGVNGNQADNSQGGTGAAYVYTRSLGVWTQQVSQAVRREGGRRLAIRFQRCSFR